MLHCIARCERCTSATCKILNFSTDPDVFGCPITDVLFFCSTQFFCDVFIENLPIPLDVLRYTVTVNHRFVVVLLRSRRPFRTKIFLFFIVCVVANLTNNFSWPGAGPLLFNFTERKGKQNKKKKKNSLGRWLYFHFLCRIGISFSRSDSVKRNLVIRHTSFVNLWIFLCHVCRK